MTSRWRSCWPGGTPPTSKTPSPSTPIPRGSRRSCWRRNSRARLLFQRQSRFLEGPPASVERNGSGIPHFFQIVGDQGRSKSAAAIEHQLGLLIRHLGNDVALDNAAAHMDSVFHVIRVPFVILAGIHQDVRLAARDDLLVAFDIDLLDARFGVIYQLEKLRTVIHGSASLHA